MKHIITGVKPTGESMHLGNLMGAVLPFRDASQGHDSAIFIADLHALTSVKDGETLRKQAFELAVEYLAIFWENTPITIFRQSDIHEITKLQWVLSNIVPYSLMLRAHSFKDAEAKNADINMGVFNYPILMAADILGYDIDAVPVGKDQLQHLEMTRDIARYFNKTYSTDIFREPEAVIAESVATLPGIDGRKMSKSYDNFIGVFDDGKKLKKRIMSIVTDSHWIDEKKDPDTCNVFALYEVYATEEQTEALRARYLSENIWFGYGHAKTALLEVLWEYLRPYREARTRLLENPEVVHAKLEEWAKIMNARLEKKMKIVKEIVGIR